ncbi:MarR family transcriptional regulator, partial [Frankia sp. AgKG'84/4]|uniref:MarR family transcriptional regulator n=1 Tax=Frankia sp. AgKG'84/4 TaxID=573490 RepID=UPI00200DB6A6
MSTEASRRRLNEAISALTRFARSRKLVALHVERAGFDLNFAALDVLDKAVEHGPMPASRLASQTHMAPNALSRQLRLLEDGGYIDRRLDRTDARVTIIEATPRGREASQRLHEAND